MHFEEIGKWKGYPVLLGHAARPFPADNRIHLSPTDFGYNMYLNNEYVGWCDSKYRVQEYKEPKRTSTFTTSWTSYPEPEHKTSEPEQKVAEPKPQPKPQPPVSTDFWSDLQAEILSTLNGVTLVKEKNPESNPKPPKPSSKPLFKFDFQ